MRFNPAPGWPSPPAGWIPPAGWKPDASWPTAPEGWPLWVDDQQDPGGLIEPDPDRLDQPSGAGLVADDTEAEQQGEREDQAGAELTRLRDRVRELEAQIARLAAPESAPIDFDDARALQDVGIYRYHHPLEDAAAYKSRLAELDAEVDELVRSGEAVLAADMFTWNGSLAQGRQLVGSLRRLLLRAYNAEADNCVRSLRSGNVQAAVRRLERSVTAIEKLGSMMEMRINPTYHNLRIRELELVGDYQMKVQEEREAAREERERLREERRAEAELQAERARLDKEREHYREVLAKMREAGDEASAAQFVDRLAQIDSAIEMNDYRTANIRAGYIYVISNVGAFGRNMVKIGMTRRLEPKDRIRELGDASVPFLYDTHALFFSDDAVSLEAELHRAFSERRVNWVNHRREFFFATPAEVRAVLLEKVGGLLEYNDTPAAPEYFQSLGSWETPDGGTRPPSQE